MREDTTTQPVVFNDLFGKPVVACFDQPNRSSDGGAVLPKACDERLGLTQAIAACVADTRRAGKVAHRFHDLVRQRVFGIACGYEDRKDVDRLAGDPIQKLLVDRDPLTGDTLASQSAFSRFENAPGQRRGCAWRTPWRTPSLPVTANGSEGGPNASRWNWTRRMIRRTVHGN